MKLKLDKVNRTKKRYLLMDGKREDIEKTILDYIGILGYAKASPEFLTDKDKLILSVERKSLNNVRAALELVKGIRVLRVSGTIKGLYK